MVDKNDTPIAIALTIDGARAILQELNITELIILGEIHQLASRDQHRLAHTSAVHFQNRYGMKRATIFRAFKKLEDLDYIVKETTKDIQASKWKYNIFITEKAEAYFLKKGQEQTPTEKPAKRPASKPQSRTEQNEGSFNAEEFLQANLERTKREDRESRTEPQQEPKTLAQTIEEQSRADREHQERIRAQREEAEREAREEAERRQRTTQAQEEEQERIFREKQARISANLSKPKEEPANTNTNIVN